MQSAFVTFLTELDNQGEPYPGPQSTLLAGAGLGRGLLCSEHRDKGGDGEEMG